MTVVELPEGGMLLPAEFGDGVVPIDGLPGCYEGYTQCLEYGWPGVCFDDWFNRDAQRRFFDARTAAVESGGPMPQELDWDNWPPDEYGIGDSPQQVMVHADRIDSVVIYHIVQVRRDH